MKKNIIMAASALALVVGCMDVETRITVNADGTGTIQETFLMKSEMAEGMKKGMGAGEEAKPDAKIYKEQELRDKAASFGRGVSFVSVEDIANATHQGYRTIYSFGDVTKITINQNMKAKSGQNAGKPALAENIIFRFAKKPSPTLTMIMPEKKGPAEKKAETKPVDDAQMEQQLKQMRLIFDGMRFALVVQINGEITKTNAANVNGNAITLYDIEFSKFLDNTEKLKELNAKKPATMEETKALLKDVPGLVIEPAKKVTVSFKAR
ncbi:MAG TPA: hypothetical protein PL135_12665 [Spirochaetota bacterium]|nr:hypothetical protein [Spirochaetota bacterium]